MSKILTIGVAAYNAEKWLRRCLDSFVIPEIIDDLDIIIVNDGSTDNTSIIAEGYVEKFPQVYRLIDKTNGGHGSTINVAIKAAYGKYFKVVDADDWVEKDGMNELVACLKKSDVDAVASPYYIINAKSGSKTYVPVAGGRRFAPSDEIYEVFRLPQDFFARLPVLTFRTELLQKNFTHLDEHCFYVDLEYDVYYFSYVKTVRVLGKPVYDYLMNTSTQSVSPANMLRHFEDHLRVLGSVIQYCEGNGGLNGIPVQCRIMIESEILAIYKILLSIPDVDKSLMMMRSFDAEFKGMSSEIYSDSVRNGIRMRKEIAIVVSMLRKSHFHWYRLIHKAFHLLSREGTNDA